MPVQSPLPAVHDRIIAQNLVERCSDRAAQSIGIATERDVEIEVIANDLLLSRQMEALAFHRELPQSDWVSGGLRSQARATPRLSPSRRRTAAQGTRSSAGSAGNCPRPTARPAAGRSRLQAQQATALRLLPSPTPYSALRGISTEPMNFGLRKVDSAAFISPGKNAGSPVLTKAASGVWGYSWWNLSIYP